VLEARADSGDCDLVAKGTVAGLARGWVRLANGQFQSDRNAEAPIGDAALRAQSATSGQEITFTCVPPGSGVRIGVDRDEDGFYDQTEIDAGSDPANPQSLPDGTLIGTTQLRMTSDVSPPIDDDKRTLTFSSSTKGGAAGHRVIVPAPGSPDDPTTAGALLRVYNGAGLTSDSVQIALPANGWKAIGKGAGFRGYRFIGPKTGPITSVVVKQDSIAIRGGKASFAYTLDEPVQGAVALRLQFGADAGWCTSSPARTHGTPPSSATYDHPGRFVGAPKTPPPATCPAPPV
jgi:hypothetical protein